MEEITAVNWLAIGIGTIVSFMLGGLWYSPKLFGTKWAAGVGIELEAETGIEPGKQPGQPVPALISQFIGTFFFAWLIGVLGSAEAPLTAILTILTIAILMMAGGLFSQKSHYAIFAEGGFVIVMGLIMVVCQHLF